MYIKKINLKDFRNYESLSLQFDKNVNLIIGNNGSGKTNLLEAIYLTSLLKSFRTNKDSEFIRFNKENANISVIVNKDDEDNLIDIIQTKEGKIVKVNDRKLNKASELIDNVYSVIFTPEDLSIVQDEPEKRRKFIDRELCQIKPLYYSNLINYRKVLLQRNAYLKEEKVMRDLIFAYDEELAKYGAYIMYERNKFINKINNVSKKIHENITDNLESLEVIYKPNIIYRDNIDDLKEEISLKLLKSYDLDLQRRTTLFGPHKDDLEFKIITKDKEIDARTYGSQGQIRTVALSLKLSEIDIIREETKENPILLLDDVLSELDLRRQEFLIKSLSGVQLFLTTADLSNELLNKLPDGKTIKIDNGKVI